jgi:hypothetical protein
MIPKVAFHRLIRRMTEGAHRPPLVLASDGHRYVLKLGQLDADFPACELLASRLATVMGVRTPEIALVEIPGLALVAAKDNPDWADLHAGHRGGLCFGSRFLGDALLRWTSDLADVTNGLPDAAVGLLAFDLLIENHDRKHGRNPNVLWVEGEIVAIDHGQSLPSVQGVSGGPGEQDLTAHVTWPVVKAERARFPAWADRLPDDAGIDAAVNDVPLAWWQPPERAGAVRAALRRRRDEVRAILQSWSPP